MRDISGYATIPSPHVVRQREAEALVRTWEGLGSTVQVDGLIGHGAAHAFGRPSGRFRFVTSVASADGALGEGPPTVAPDGWDAFQGHPEFEWFQLAGHADLLDMDGLDRAPEHRFGTDQLQRELELRRMLRLNPLSPPRLQDLLVAHEFEAMSEYIEEVCVRLRVPVPPSLRTGNWGPDSMPAIRTLVASIPTARTWSTLRYLKHRDHNLPWEQHDWTDLWALSVAIPYCDIVVTEKRWRHLAAVSGLDSQFKTTVLAGRAALEGTLDRTLELSLEGTDDPSNPSP